MKKLSLALLLVVAVAVLGGIALANTAVKGDDPAMMVSPQTIVLAKVDSVTVHTNIPFGDVVAGSLTLEGAAPLSVWADNCGHIAARFAIADLGLTPGAAVLTLEGLLKPDEPFSAQDDVTVK